MEKASKKILIEATPLLSSLTGIGRYIYEISSRLDSYDECECEFFYGYISKSLYAKKNSQLYQILRSKIIKKLLVASFNTKSIIDKKKYDTYWQPNFIPSLRVDAQKVVTTVHDFSFLNPKFHPTSKIMYYKKNFFNYIKRSHTIITGSNYTKNEILSHIDIREDRVKVIYHGVNHSIFKPNIKNIPLSLPSKYILFTGSIEPRKNIITLIKAYTNLSSKLQEEYKLLLVGASGWKNSEIFYHIKSKKNIFYIGYISDEELAKVYSQAECFIYPSLYEGFGLPPLEAMACATPVISSNTSSMPEVLQDAALYFEPTNYKELSQKIIELLSSKELRSKLISKGLKQAKKFNWDISAKKHKETLLDT